MTEMLAIIDYGSGNLRSASKSFERVIGELEMDCSVKITSSAEDIRNAGKIVLPGQGAFGSCMAGLSSIPGMLDALKENVLENGVPFLGICVGMQLLADKGLEYGDYEGLGWIGGEVVKMTPGDKALKIPHMGWNKLTVPDNATGHPLLDGIEEDDYFYFVHSFVFELEDRQNILACAEYGGSVTAIVGRDNIAGVQFHPEKSQKSGMRLIKNFLNWKP